LAKGFLTELESYAAKIQGQLDRKQIEESVKQTIGLLKQYREASTIDQLIGMILNKKRDAYLTADARTADHGFKYQADLGYRALDKAKVATSACFLEKEEQAMNWLLPKYQTFIREIFIQDGIGAPYTPLHRSPKRKGYLVSSLREKNRVLVIRPHQKIPPQAVQVFSSRTTVI